MFLWGSVVGFAVQAQTSNSGIIISNSHSWKPYSFVEDGEPKGLLIDFWRLYSQINHTPVSFVLTDWNESLEFVAGGGRKVHAGLLYSSEREQFLDYAFPLMELSTSLYVLNDSPALKDQQIKKGAEIGVVRGGYEEYFLKTHYPQAELKSFDNNAQLIRAGKGGSLQRMVIDSQVATYYFSQHDEPYQFVPIERLYQKMMYAAVSEGNDALRKEIEAGFHNIPQHEIDRIEQKWLNTQSKTTVPSWLWPALAGFLVAVTLIYIGVLKRTVAKKTQQLKELNDRLGEYAFTDSLTGVLNRRALERKFKGKQVTGLIKRGRLGVLVLDVDHFKRINDTYGHTKGDEVLSNLGRALQHYLPEAIAICRLGGEEFCVLVAAEDLGDLEVSAEYLCAFVVPKSQTRLSFSLTASVGALFVDNAKQDLTLEGLLHCADQLMFQAKRNGRNRVVIGAFSSVYHRLADLA